MTTMNGAQIQILLDAAVSAGDAGIAEHARRALDTTLAASEPWAVAAAAQKCAGFVAHARRHGGETVNEWTLPAELLVEVQS
jgi:hypothetical protein